MKNKTYICNKCQRFLAELKQNGYLEIKNSKSISSNGKEFVIRCKCGEMNIIKIGGIMEVNGKIFISSKHIAEDYRVLNLKIDSDEEVWKKAIEIFNDRISSRFIEPIEYLLNSQKPQFEFSALAIISLLIETLQQFKDGKENNCGKSKGNYKNFLDKELKLEDPNIFYLNVRCGLLHQGEILDKIVIVPYEKSYNDISNEPIIKENKLNTEILFKKILSYFKNYLDLLLNPCNRIDRENFIKKMDSIVNKIR